MRLGEFHRTTAFRFSVLSSALLIGMAVALSGFIYWRTAIAMDQDLDALLHAELGEIIEAPAAQMASAIDEQLREDPRQWKAELFSVDGLPEAGNIAALPGGLPADDVAREFPAGFGGGTPVHAI